MIAFEVDDMTCGHCASTLAKALKGADKDAEVQIDLATRRVLIASATAHVKELAEAIKDAGYTPVPVEAAVAVKEPAEKRGCCGCGG